MCRRCSAAPVKACALGAAQDVYPIGFGIVRRSCNSKAPRPRQKRQEADQRLQPGYPAQQIQGQ
jgi:hypothetical protein